MPRSPRFDYAGATHHAFNRGACHAPIFFERRDYELFLALLAILPRRFGARVLAYALMTNHYHLVLVAPRGNLSDIMRYLLGVYVRRLNDRHERDGSPFRGRFANRVVESENYLRQVLAYVHLNPVRAGLADHPARADWTSHRAAIGLEPAPAWLDVSWVADVFGDARAFADFMEQVEPTDEPCPPPSTEELCLPGAPTVDATPVAEALARAAGLVGIPRRSIRAAGGRAGQLLAWTLSVDLGLTHRETAAILRITPAAVSQRVRRFETWCASSDDGCRWRDAIAARSGVARPTHPL